jgi:hypothetical protein
MALPIPRGAAAAVPAALFRKSRLENLDMFFLLEGTDPGLHS